MSEEIEARVLELLNKTCADGEYSGTVSLDANLGNLGIDSLKLVAMIFELEKDLGFEADEGQLANLRTVSDVVQMIETAVLSGVS